MDLFEHAAETLRVCRTAGLTLATAESCTGGLIATALTEVPGSSDVVDRAYVTYSNTAKTQMLGVKAGLIRTCGAVSENVAVAMAEGALGKAKVGVAVSVTGVAGPGGGSEEKPVGLVHIGCAVRTADGTHRTVAQRHLWRLIEPNADRVRIRALSARAALLLVQDVVEGASARP